MQWNKEYLDLILVPSGLFIMFGYHIFLLYRYLTNSESTSIGYESHCKKAWVRGTMQIDIQSRGPAFSVVESTIQAATFMASTSLVLASLIGTWIANSSNNSLVTRIIYGDTRTTMTSIKYISILFFFLISFVSFIQSSRCYVHANFLLSMPKATGHEDLTVEALIQGSNFWHVGLRSIYFSVMMLMWLFGPIPMLVSSMAMVLVLFVLDVNRKPFRDFFSPEENMLKRVEEEVKAVTTVVGHLGRPNGGHFRDSIITGMSSS